MLAPNANDEGFSLSITWMPRRAAALAAETAARAASLAALGASQLVTGRVRLVSVVVQSPISLPSLTATDAPRQRIDGVDVGRGDRVLLVAQPDARENGLWTIGGGSTSPYEDAFNGMLVRVQGGTVAGGWLYCCTAYNDATRAAAFHPVISPLPSKGQLDSLAVDAQTLAGRPSEYYLNKTIEGVGGALSLVINGDPMPSSGTQKIRGLSGGPAVTISAGTNQEAVVSVGPTNTSVCLLRPADITATGGRFRLRSDASLPGAPTWPVTAWNNEGWPLLLYPATTPADAPHSGDVLGILYGTPAAPLFGWHVDFICAWSAPLATDAVFTVSLTQGGPDATGTVLRTLQGTLTLPAAGSSLSGVIPVTATSVSPSSGAVVGVDGVSRPVWGAVGGVALVGCRLASSTACPVDLFVLGIRFTLTPPR